MHIYSIIGYLIINGYYSINALNCNLGNNAWFSKPTWYKKNMGTFSVLFFLIACTFVYKVTKYVLKNNAQNKSLKQKGIQRDFKNSLAES